MSIKYISTLPEITVLRSDHVFEVEDPTLPTDDPDRQLHVSLANLLSGATGGKTITGGDSASDTLTLQGPDSIVAEDPLEFGDSAGFRISVVGSNLWMTGNAYHDGANWLRNDISKDSFALEMDYQSVGPTVTLYRAAAAANPISAWSVIWSGDPDQILTVGGAEVKLENSQTVFCRLAHAVIGAELHSGILTNMLSDESGVDDSSSASWFSGAVDDSFRICRAPSGGSTTLATLMEMTDEQLEIRQQAVRIGPIQYALTTPSAGSTLMAMDKVAETDEATIVMRVGGAERWRVGALAEGGGSPNDFHIKHADGSAGSETYKDLLVVKHGTEDIEMGDTAKVTVQANGIMALASLSDDASADPCPNGSLYYNTTSNTVRVKTDGVWGDIFEH